MSELYGEGAVNCMLHAELVANADEWKGVKAPKVKKRIMTRWVCDVSVAQVHLVRKNIARISKRTYMQTLTATSASLSPVQKKRALTGGESQEDNLEQNAIYLDQDPPISLENSESQEEVEHQPVQIKTETFADIFAQAKKLVTIGLIKNLLCPGRCQ